MPPSVMVKSTMTKTTILPAATLAKLIDDLCIEIEDALMDHPEAPDSFDESKTDDCLSWLSDSRNASLTAFLPILRDYLLEANFSLPAALFAPPARHRA